MTHHKNVKLVHPLSFLIAVVALSGFKSDETFTLKQKYKKDDVATYHQTFNASAEDSEFSVDMKNRFKVLSVEEDGAYEVEETMLEGTFKVNGDEMPMEKGDPKVRKFDKEGKEVKKADDEEDEDDPVSKIVEDVFDYEPKNPVKIGETWDIDSEFTTIHAKLEGKEKVGDVECFKITIQATLSKKDTSGDVTGTFYVRADDFSPEKMEAKVDNPKLDAETTMKKIEMTMTRVAD